MPPTIILRTVNMVAYWFQDNPYRYCEEYIDNETGFIYLRNRYYDPKIGRFISEDPAKSSSNWYVYCGNNPVKFTDP